MTDIVWQDDPVTADVERLSRSVKFVSKLGSQELLSSSACAVQNHHGVVDFALGIPMGLTERRVVDANTRPALAALETEVVDDEVAFLNGPSNGRIRGGRSRC